MIEELYINYVFIFNFFMLQRIQCIINFFMIRFPPLFSFSPMKCLLPQTASRAFIDFHWIFFYYQHECSYRIFSLSLGFCDFCFINLAAPAGEQKVFLAESERSCDAGKLLRFISGSRRTLVEHCSDSDSACEAN